MMNTGIKRGTTPYPLLSMLYAIVLLSYFYLQTQPDLQWFYRVPSSIFNRPISELSLALFVIVLWLELRYVQRRRNQQQSAVDHINAQISELLENKKQLNAKAHIYASHADKLKLFISDKLLEYIEYDEKFLHFKSIASEVRHNGVISYDKISTLLEQQIADLENADDAQFAQLCDARDSLHYLWDLLDLSTADNIALHIANQVCESEELLFQTELADGAAALEKPVFDPQRALKKALARCFGSEPLPLENISDTDGVRDSIDLHIADQQQIWIRCHPTAPLLGNENHIVLALENIISNAQFFAGRKDSRRSVKQARIAIELDQHGAAICYRIYNRGPHINEDTAAKLFQLGYSTRRAKEHHGKGLGLYFVNEIIKGYEGKVAFTNIHNQADMLTLRIAMASGEVITEVIHLVTGDNGPACRKSGSHAATESLGWELYGALQSIAVTHQSDQQTHHLAHAAIMAGSIDDPGQPAHPRWRLEIERGKKQTLRLHFQPLDIAGVHFEIRLPSLTSRLEGDLLNPDAEDMNRQLESISGRFKTLDA